MKNEGFAGCGSHFLVPSKELYMKKKIVLVALLVALVMVPAFAAPMKKASSVSLGAQVGYPTGVAVAADFGFNEDWYLVTDAGLLLGQGLGVAGDVLVNWTFATADGFRHGDKWEFAAGAGAGVGVFFGDPMKLYVRPEGDVRVTYAFNEGWDVFFRLDLGCDITILPQFATGFGFGASLGVTYAL
jgi:hypothetical protein